MATPNLFPGFTKESTPSLFPFFLKSGFVAAVIDKIITVVATILSEFSIDGPIMEPILVTPISDTHSMGAAVEDTQTLNAPVSDEPTIDAPIEGDVTFDLPLGD